MRSGLNPSEFRHLHPAEAAHLSGVHADFFFPMKDLRAALPLIGQLASPIHSRWVFLQLRDTLIKAHLIEETVKISEKDNLLEFLENLNQRRQQFWPQADTCLPRTVELSEQGTTLCLQVPPFAKAKQLVLAQKQILGWGSRVELLHNGRVLDDEEYLHSTSYEVVESLPRALKPLASRKIQVGIVSGETVQTHEFPIGTFVSDVLAFFEIDTVGDYCFASSVLHRGDRLWHDFIGTIRGSGNDGADGLDVDTVNSEALSLFRPDDNTMVLLPVIQTTDILLKPKVIAGYQIKQMIEQCLREREGPPFKFGILICHEGHWSLFVYRVLQENAILFDSIPGRHDGLAMLLAKVFADYFGHSPSLLPSKTMLLQRNDDLCGVHALINLGAELGLWTEFSYDEAEAWMHALSNRDPIRGCGAIDFATAQAALTELLPSKGVPVDRASERAALALKRLGLNPILRALAADNQWQALKSLGSNNERPFMWVSADELKQHIAHKAHQKFGASGKNKTKKPKDDKFRPPLSLPIDQLAIPDGAFVDSAKHAVLQIPLEKVKADARGIAVASVEQAMRFLQDGKCISTDHLALLTSIEIPAPTPGHLIVENITWPAIFQKDPLLVKGSLLQLGDQHVALKKGPPPASSAVATVLMRFQVYKDQWPHDWQTFIKGPLRQLVGHFAPLQVCTTTGCGATCPKFHPAVEETCDLVLLDCFSWRWFTDAAASTSAPKSASFSIMIRAPHSAVDGILNISGHDGFYPELREQDGTPSKYAIIWLKVDYQEALHVLQVQPTALHLIRLHQRFGLRCLRKNEAELRKQIFPDETYVSCDIKLLYEIGPYGHGFSKAQVQDSLKGLAWTARVLKPAKGGPHGRYWLVGAEAAPSCAVFPCGDLQITIGKVKDVAPNRGTQNIVASLQTIQRIQGQASSSSSATPDPWIQKDPWSTYKASYSAPPASAGAAAPSARIDQLEERLTAKLQTQIDAAFPLGHADISMDDDQEMRLDRIEADMIELKQQNQTFNAWFAEAGERMNSMQQTIANQGNTVEHLTSTVQQQGNTMMGIQNSLNSMEGNLRGDLKAAMDRMEVMLSSKKARCEWLLHPRRVRTGFSGGFLFWIWLLCLLLCGRMGEATNPGPDNDAVPREYDFVDASSNLVLGTCNPTGIARRAVHLLELPRGVWGLSETQATKQTFDSFRKELRFEGRRQGRSMRAIHGAFAPLRSTSSTAGAWTGVGFMADTSLRPIQLPWKSFEYLSGRVLVACSLFGPHHLIGANVYAPPNGPTYGMTTKLCEELLEVISANVVFGASG